MNYENFCHWLEGFALAIGGAKRPTIDEWLLIRETLNVTLDIEDDRLNKLAKSYHINQHGQVGEGCKL